MINSRLLNEFKSELGNTNRTVIIKDIYCEPDSCGQEVLTIVTEQILKPFGEIKKGYDVIQKTLEVEGHLDLNDSKEFYTNLVGFISNEGVVPADETIITEEDILNDIYRSPTSHYIEIIKTPISKKIQLEFNKAYDSKPIINITIDKKDEDLYKSYSTEFIQNNDFKYSGVIITFNNLKSKNSYPEIGISILGDPIESYSDGMIKTEEKVNIHLFKTKTKTEIYLFEMIDMIKNDIKNVEVIIKDENDESISYTTDNCGRIYPILKYGTYTIKINNEDYDGEITKEITITEDNTSFELEFSKIEEEVQEETPEGE